MTLTIPQGTVSSMLTTLKRSFSSAFDREKSTTQQGELDKKRELIIVM